MVVDKFDVVRPVLPSFRADDNEIASYIDSIKNKHLNFRDKKFFVRNLNREFSFDSLVDALHKKVISRDVLVALADIFTRLPGDMDTIKDELVWQLKRINALLEDYASLASDMDSFVDAQESHISELASEIDFLQKKLVLVPIVEPVKVVEPVKDVVDPIIDSPAKKYISKRSF